jgi:hypothetical protein
VVHGVYVSASGLTQAEQRIADVLARGSDLLSLRGLGLKALPSIPSHSAPIPRTFRAPTTAAKP